MSPVQLFNFASLLSLGASSQNLALVQTKNRDTPVQTFAIDDWFKAFSGCQVTLFDWDTVPFSSVGFPVLSNLNELVPVQLYTPTHFWRVTPKASQHFPNCHASLLTNVEYKGQVNIPLAGRRVLVALFRKFRSTNHHIHVLVPQSFSTILRKNIIRNIVAATKETDLDTTRLVLLLKEHKHQKLQAMGSNDQPGDGTTPGLNLRYEHAKVRFFGFLLLCVSCPRKFRHQTTYFQHFTFKETIKSIEKQRLRYLALQSFRVENMRELTIVGKSTRTRPLLPNSLLEIAHTINEKFGNSTIIWSSKSATAPYLMKDFGAVPRVLYLSSPFRAATSFIPSEVEQVNFITCYVKPETGNLVHLARPLGLAVWALLAITCGTLLGLALVILRSSVGSTAFLLLSVLLESAVPTALASRSAFSRFVIALVMLLSLVISNGYKGTLTSEITAPPERAVPEDFDDLDGFDLYAEAAYVYKVCTVSVEKFNTCLVNRTNEYRRLRQESNYTHLDDVDFVNGYMSSSGMFALMYISARQLMMNSGTEEERQLFKTRYTKDVELVKRTYEKVKVSLPFPETSGKTIVSRCGKTAYVDFEAELPNFTPVLNASSEQNFVKGRLGIMRRSVGFGFIKTYQNGNFLRNVFKQLAIESGIYDWLHFKARKLSKASLGMLWIQKEIQERRAVRNRKLSLKSRLVKASFSLYGIMTGISIMAFVVEIVVRASTKYWYKGNDQDDLNDNSFHHDECTIIQVQPRALSRCNSDCKGSIASERPESAVSETVCSNYSFGSSATFVTVNSNYY